MIKEEFGLIIEKLEDEIMDHYSGNLVAAAVFGSVASSTMTYASDIDLLICANGLPRGRMPRLKDFRAVERKMEGTFNNSKKKGLYTSLSPVIKTPEEIELGSLLFIDMTENVKILYDRDDFLKNYLGRLKEKLVKLGSKKIQIGSAWFWDLIPNYKMIREVDL